MKHVRVISKADTGIALSTVFDRIQVLLQLLLAAEPIIDLKKSNQGA